MSCSKTAAMFHTNVCLIAETLKKTDYSFMLNKKKLMNSVCDCHLIFVYGK